MGEDDGTVETFEEQVSGSIDAMFDGAKLMTGDAARAEALVVASVVDAARRYRREPPEHDFHRWILTRLVRQYARYVDRRADSGEDEREGGAGRSTLPLFARVCEDRPVGESDVESLMAWMVHAKGRSPDRLSAMVRREMANLPLTERVALWLVNVVGFDYRGAAATLEMGVADLRQVLLHARRELQARLAVSLQRDMMETPADGKVRRANDLQA